MKTNAIMLKTVKNAGTLQSIKVGEAVRISLPLNLPNEGRDQQGKPRYFAVSESGIETLVYRDEFQFNDDFNRSVEHIRKFSNFAWLLNVSFFNSSDLPKIIASIEMGDVHLNSIPMRKWDMYHISYQTLGLKIDPFWCLSYSVCTAKIAAQIAGLQQMGYATHDPELIKLTLDSFAQRKGVHL